MPGLREAGLEDLPRLNAFHRFFDPRLWIQEYWDFLSEHSVLAVADQGEALAGTQAFIPYRLNIDGHIYLTGRSERTLVSGDYRGKGLFAQLMDFAEKRATERGMHLIWGSTSAEKAFKNVGFYSFNGHRQQMVAFINGREVLKGLWIYNWDQFRRNFAGALKERDMAKTIECMKPICILLSPVFRLLQSTTFRPNQGSDFHLTDEPKSYGDIDELYNNLRQRGHLIYISQDPGFVKWFSVKANRKMLRLFCYKQKKLVAYCYADISETTVASIIDFAALDPHAFRYLIYALFGKLKLCEVSFVRAACSIRNIQQKRLLSQFYLCGFIPFCRGGTFVTHPLTYRDVSVLNDIKHWYITDLWYLLYRNREA